MQKNTTTDEDRAAQNANRPRPTATLRRRVYETIEIGQGENRANWLFDSFIVALIILNVAAFIAAPPKT